MRFKKLLCAIDFSDASREAMRLGVEFSARLSAPLTLLHVYQPPTYVLPEGSVVLASPEALSDLQRQVVGAMEDWKKVADLDASSLGAAPVEVRTVQGVAWQEIVRLAEEGEFQLLAHRACEKSAPTT